MSGPTHHATAVAIDGRGVLLIGPSGSGKSAMALAMMANGARLVADDRVRLWRQGDTVMADAPPALSGLIEARGVGILRAAPTGAVPLALICDLGRDSVARLPRARGRALLGVVLPLVSGRAGTHLSNSLIQALKGGLWTERLP